MVKDGLEWSERPWCVQDFGEVFFLIKNEAWKDECDVGSVWGHMLDPVAE
jgi:hypothetical protein